MYSYRAILNYHKKRTQMKKETLENQYMRWEQDNSLVKTTNLSLFDEYLEMGK